MKDRRPLYDPDERIFTLEDIKKLFVRQKKKIYRASCLGALISCSVFLIKSSPAYLITATFKESGNKSISSDGDPSKLLGMMNTDSPTIAVMRSYRVLKPLVERMGFQAAVVPKKSLLFKIYRRIKENLLSEMGKPLDDVDWFAFSDVHYPGGQNIQYILRFDDPERFSILSGIKTVATGSLGSTVSTPEVQFTLRKVPKNLQLKFPYQLCFTSWVSAVQAIRSNFQIKSSDKIHKTIFDLNFCHRDRHFGTELLNALMEEYRKYLKQDHDQIAKDQLIYLEEKQEDISKQMSKVFDEYTGYLQNNLSQSGKLGLKQEIEELSKEYGALSEKMLSLDLEEERLTRMEKDQTFAVLDESLLSIPLKEILKAISDLKQQRDLIQLSFPLNPREFNSDQYERRKEELKNIREQMSMMHHLLCQADKENKPLFDPDPSLEMWRAGLNEVQGKEKQDFTEYLENSLRLLSMQEKIVQEQIFYGRETPSECAGIDLTTARSLFVDYNHQLDKSAAMMAHFSRLSTEIEHSDFEISSLGTVLQDSLSQQLVQQTSEIALKLKDEKHRSEKEESRWTEELKLQKKILKDHLEQLYKVELLKSTMMQDKIAALQALSLNCITGQIFVLQEQLSDCIHERKNTIATEKTILTEKMKQIRNSFPNIPERCRKEKWINLKTQMGIKMIYALTDLVESKTIASHLHHIESKPLDIATAPFIPRSPSLFLKTCLLAFLAGFASFFRSFLRAVITGFPTSKEKLRAMQYPLVGEISLLCDGPPSLPPAGSDLETLRQISLFIDQSSPKKVIGILEAKGPDYSYAFAKHLSHMSLSPLLVRCDFPIKSSPQDRPGLLQVWEKEIDEIPIRKQQGYDFLPSGGYTLHGAELIRSEQFQKLLKDWKNQYDCILLVFRSPLDSVESMSPLAFCDKAIVTVSDEPTDQLTPFINWAYHEGVCRLSFLTTSPI